MKLRGPIVIPILAVVLIALAFGLWWMFGRTDKLPDTIVRGNGRLEMTRTDIAAKYPGRLMSLDVHEGDLVGAGQVIARQDDVDLKTQLAGALAKREQAVSALMRAQGELAARDSQAQLARIDWVETGKLRERDMVSNVELEPGASEAKLVVHSTFNLSAHRRGRIDVVAGRTRHLLVLVVPRNMSQRLTKPNLSLSFVGKPCHRDGLLSYFVEAG